jgi:two-component system, chemotaxis family, chemotaxis protein CheY
MLKALQSIKRGELLMGKPKILIVDEALFMRNVLADTAKELGFTEAYFAEDGINAIEKAKEIQPNLVIFDISMPAMNGLDAIDRILGASPKSKIIMVSAISDKEMVKEAIKKGAIDFITKPFSKKDVEDMLKRHVG